MVYKCRVLGSKFCYEVRTTESEDKNMKPPHVSMLIFFKDDCLIGE